MYFFKQNINKNFYNSVWIQKNNISYHRTLNRRLISASKQYKLSI